MKRLIEGADRGPVTLLPEHLDDYVAEDNRCAIRMDGLLVVHGLILNSYTSREQDQCIWLGFLSTGRLAGLPCM